MKHLPATVRRLWAGADRAVRRLARLQASRRLGTLALGLVACVLDACLYPSVAPVCADGRNPDELMRGAPYSAHFDMPAASGHGWWRTNVTVVAGQSFGVVASGRAEQLVGRIGPDGPEIPIGACYSGVTPRGGSLYLSSPEPVSVDVAFGDPADITVVRPLPAARVASQWTAGQRVLCNHRQGELYFVAEVGLVLPDGRLRVDYLSRPGESEIVREGQPRSLSRIGPGFRVGVLEDLQADTRRFVIGTVMEVGAHQLRVGFDGGGSRGVEWARVVVPAESLAGQRVGDQPAPADVPPSPPRPPPDIPPLRAPCDERNPDYPYC